MSVKKFNECAMLTSLRVCQWGGRKFDRVETQRVLLENNANANAARVNKHLLPKCDELERIQRKTSEVRNLFYQYTLPWGVEGINVISTRGYIRFTQVMSPALYEWRELVPPFLAVYQEEKDRAQYNLGGLWRAEDYPTTEELRHKFSIDLTFMPVPDVSDFRVDILDEHKEAFLRQARAQEEGVAQAAWARIFDVVKKAADKLRDPDAIFRDSLVENARELCELLPSLNVTDDPVMEKARRDIEGSLCAHHPDTLRHVPDVRENTVNQLDAIMRKMGQFYAPAQAAE